MIKVLFLLTSFIFSLTSYSADKICTNIYIHGEIELSEVEERMVCGDEKLNAYNYIPTYQASYFLKGFLQSRGYLQPDFELKGEDLHVSINSPSYAKKFKIITDIDDERKHVKKELKRLFKNKLLTTKTLNAVEAEAKSLVRQRGYPCAEVSSLVDISKGEITVELKRMNYFVFGEVDKESIEGLRENALERYYAFNSNQAFDETLLKLTEKRMIRAEVVQGTYFLEKCEEEPKDFSLQQKFIAGLPRTIRFGAGANTEVGPMARVKWSQNRFGHMASQLSATLQASLRSQSLNLMADNYIWPDRPRRSIFSQLTLDRDSQFEFDQTVLRIKSHYKWTIELEKRQTIYTLGPAYEIGTYSSSEESSTKEFSTGILEGAMQIMSHRYEFFDMHPQEGDLFAFNFDFRHPSLGFSDPMLKLEASYVKLTRLMTLGRGTLNAGVRFNAGTTWVNDNVGLEALPPAVKFYGGGSDDIRGYLLKTLPKNGGLGALSRAAMKLEMRKTYLWKESIEAFSFLDTAFFGDESWSVEKKLWYTPGLGLRWLSPIGLAQGYWARALSLNPNEDNGNFFYAGLGGVF